MGNYMSCTLPPPLMKNSKVARVIFPTGEVKQYRYLVKAAELMLETPNYFLANSCSLHTGHRFSALAVDEELEFGNVYIFFPMRRLNSVITAADIAVLFMATNLVPKRLSGAGKVCVLPENSGEKGTTVVGEENLQARGVENGVPRLSLDGVDLGFDYRVSCGRSWKPVLETINEEPICSR